MFRQTAGAVLGALLLALAAGSARAETIQIKIAKLAFVPAQVTAHVGDTIEWVNDDFLVHTATARNGAWDLTVRPSASASVVLTGAGIVDYYCRFHPNMIGRITVSK